MIIQCTSCDKKFSVPDGAITGNGRLVQCSSCGNKWTQYPVKLKENVNKTEIVSKKIQSVKKTKKKKGPVPYSKEYMKQKWGVSAIQTYSKNEGFNNKKTRNKPKEKTKKNINAPGFGFFNYIITLTVLSTFFIGILNFERTRISRKFPGVEPYINHFFETLENFKIFILDLIK